MADFDLASSLAGGMLGLLVGDAVGVPYEFRLPGRSARSRCVATGATTSQQARGATMALALADSLLPATAGADPRAAQFDPDDQGRRIVAWWRESAYTPDDDRPFDVGGTTLAAIRALETGRPAVDAGRATASRAAASASRSCWGRSAWVTRDSTGGDLDLDVARLRTLGVDVLLLLVEDDELAWCHVPELPAVIRAAASSSSGSQSGIRESPRTTPRSGPWSRTSSRGSGPAVRGHRLPWRH